MASIDELEKEIADSEKDKSEEKKVKDEDQEKQEKENKTQDEEAKNGWNKVDGFSGSGFDRIINSQDWEDEKKLVGVYKQKIDNFTKFSDPAYVFVTTDDKEVAIVAPTILRSRLEQVEKATAVKIVSKGMTETKSGQEAYDFDVYTKD